MLKVINDTTKKINELHEFAAKAGIDTLTKYYPRIMEHTSSDHRKFDSSL